MSDDEPKPEPFTAWVLVTPSGTILERTIALDDRTPFYKGVAFDNLGSIAEAERAGWRVIKVKVVPDE